ncbi:hypothetical protein Tco_0115562 [Tanacetum coccineum]
MRRAEQLLLDVIRMMRASEGNTKRKLLNLWELRKRLDQSERILQVKIPYPKKMCRYYHKLWHLKKTTIIAEGTVYKSDGKIMLHNKALPKDCYKVSIDKSLVDAAFIPDVGSNGCTTVLDAVGTGENKTAPKVQTKRKNVNVSSDAMQKEANKKRSQKALDEMLRLQRLGSNTETGVPYTEEEIMAIVRKGKQRGHLPGLGRVLSGRTTGGSPPPPQSTVDPADVEKLKKSNKSLTKQVKMTMRLFRSDDKFSQMLDQFESSPEFGGASGSGGCGDDEPGGDEDEENGDS